MVQILPQIQEQEQPPSFLEGLGMGASQALPGAVEKYFSNLANQRQQQQANETYKRLGFDLSGLGPEAQQAAFSKLLEYSDKSNERRTKSEQNADLLRGVAKQYGVKPEELQEFTSNPKLALDTLKAKQPKEQKLSPSEKILQEYNTKQYVAATEELPKLQNTLSTIKDLRQQAKKISGPSGYIKAFFGSADASEFDATGLSLIEPVLKIFNPVGAIPTQKIDLIRKKFAPNATDTSATINGKLNALERIAKQAQGRAQEKIKLYQQYGQNPPQELVNKFDNESAQLLDTISDQPIKENENTILDSLSDQQVQELVLETGGDINKAKKMALERYGK